MDPPGCKDIDDALHVRELENGNLELGVHIADVTSFLVPGTAMDIEAASRCGQKGRGRGLLECCRGFLSAAALAGLPA